MVLISLVDKKRQWFKSKQGLDVNETCRKSSFCGHAISLPATLNPINRIMQVSDTLLDQRFHDNPLVVGDPYIRFYAGFVLQSHDDHNLGTLCLIDTKPKVLTDDDLAALLDIGMVTQDALQSLRYEDKDIHTSLYNRREFLSVADYVLQGAAKQELHCTLVYIKKLNFSQLVEKFGSLIEREMLINFIDTLKSIFRSSDVIARIGEDEFLILTSHNQSFEIERVLIQLKEKMQLVNKKRQDNFHAQYQIGSVSFSPEYFELSGRLIDLVDKRMSESQYNEICSLVNR
ncbi:MAG: diguanylate cyclase [Gammaproteobacteria bacterium]